MGRLADKLNKARNAMDDFHVATEKKVDDLIARVNKAGERRDAAFMRKHETIDRHMTDIAEFEKDLEDFDGKNDQSDASEGSGSSWTPPKY